MPRRKKSDESWRQQDAPWRQHAHTKVPDWCEQCHQKMKEFDIHKKCPKHRRPHVRKCNGRDISCSECRQWPQHQLDALAWCCDNSERRAKRSKPKPIEDYSTDDEQSSYSSSHDRDRNQKKVSHTKSATSDPIRRPEPHIAQLVRKSYTDMPKPKAIPTKGAQKAYPPQLDEGVSQSPGRTPTQDETGGPDQFSQLQTVTSGQLGQLDKVSEVPPAHIMSGDDESQSEHRQGEESEQDHEQDSTHEHKT